MEEVKTILDETKNSMDKCIQHTEVEFANIRAGKASPSMLDGLSIDYYGAMTPVSQAANITTPDARTIVIQPWDKGLIGAIEKAIIDSNLGLNPQNDGIMVRLNIPPLTEDRRKGLVKTVKAEGENAKVTIRNIRKDGNERIKKHKKTDLPKIWQKTEKQRCKCLLTSTLRKLMSC